MSKNTKCPCGCGYVLGLQPGNREELVCPKVWSQVAEPIQATITNPATPVDARRKATRFVLDLAIQIKRQRPPVPKQQELFAFAGRRGA